MTIQCPECGQDADEVNPSYLDETGVEFVVASGGEIVSMKEVEALEYEFRPCGHTAIGTQDQS